MIKNDGTVKFHKFMRCLLCYTACKMRHDFFRGICICISAAENAFEKQVIPERDVMEPVYSGVICGKVEILL